MIPEKYNITQEIKEKWTIPSSKLIQDSNTLYTEIRQMINDLYYDEKIEEAKINYEKAQEKFKEAKSGEIPVTDLIKEAQENMKKANTALQKAQENLKEVVSEINKAGGDKELESPTIERVEEQLEGQA